MIDRLSEPYQVDHHTLYVGASVGSAEGPRDGGTVEEMMRNADLALYQAKDMGGGEHCRFEPELHASAEERRQLEVSLRTALGRDEMVLHYQPVVDANTEELVSFEALVRWNSAEHGFVSPGKFIPLAEDTRLIVPIGRWVMRKACEEARNWPEHVKVNVNVSPEQLLEPGFHAEVVQALAATGLRPERLEVEVTESIFLRDASVARNALEQVMALGCSVALDDFGTGYSSLGYLRKLKFSTIKVDRSFVQGAAQGSKESLAIINAVVAMAQSLDMTTTAEGVLAAEPAAVQALTLRLGAQALALQRVGEGWNVAGKPLPPALLPRVNLAVKFLHTAKPVRVLEGADLQEVDTAALGFGDQSLSVSVQSERAELRLSFGKPTPEGSLQYLRVDGQDKLYLMSRFVGEEWEAVWAGLH